MGEELVDFQRNVKSYKRAKLTCPRWSIKPHHLRQLEEIFKEVQAPSLALRQAVAEQMGVTPRQVRTPARSPLPARAALESLPTDPPVDPPIS